MNEDIVNLSYPEISEKYTESTITKCPTKTSMYQVSHSKDTFYTPNPKTMFYRLMKGKITAMDKGKNIQIELPKEEL